MRKGEWPEYVRNMHEIAEEDINYFFPFSIVTISPYISWQFYWQPSFYLSSIPRTGPFTQLPFSLKSHRLSLGLLQGQLWSKATPFTYYNLLIKIILLSYNLDGIILLKPNRFLLELQLNSLNWKVLYKIFSYIY